MDGDVELVYIVDSMSAMDWIDIVLPFNEEILEVIIVVERLWDDLHHWSYFLHDLHEVESNLSSPSSSGNVHNPLAPSYIYAEGNMSNVSEIILVHSSKSPNVIFIKADCSPKEYLKKYYA